MIDLVCSVFILAAITGIAIAYAGRLVRAGAAHHARVDAAASSPLLSRPAMEMGYWAIRPLGRLCIAAGASANGVSWASLALAAVAGLALASGHFGVGAALTLGSAVCDALDGLVARETGTASDSGEVLDAAVDRYAELFFFGGLAFFERGSGALLALTLAASAGAVMVSYATAKAEALHVVVPGGAMRRHERAVYLVLGVTLVPIAGAAGVEFALPPWVERLPLVAVLAVVGGVANASAIRRLKAVADAVTTRAIQRRREASRAINRGQATHAAAGTVVR